MAAASSTVIIHLSVSGASTFISATTAAAGSVSGIGSAAQTAESRTSKAFKAMGGIVKNGALALGAVGAAAAAMGVNYDMGMEQSRVAFTQFLGSGKKADAMIARLQDLNKATPFEFPELADTTKRLLAMGFNAKDAVHQTQSLADAVAGIGGGGAELSRASLAIGQIASKGKLSAEDLMQLTELGVVGMQDLAKQFNMSGGEFAKAMSQGKISSDEALTAIDKITRTKFGGAAAKQSKTFAGQLSNLKDTTQQLLGEAMLPLFTFLRDEGMPALQDAMPTIKTLVTLFGKALITAINAAVDAGKFLVEHWGTIQTVAMVLGPILLGVITYMGIMTAIAIAQAAPITLLAAAWAAFNFVMALNPAVLVLAAFVALAAGLVILYKKCEWFRNAVDAIWGAIKTAFAWLKANWKTALVAILTGPFGIAVILITRNWDKIKSVISSLPGKVKSVLGQVLNFVKSGAGRLADAAKDLGSKIIHGIVDGIKAAPGLLLDAIKALLPGGAVGKKLASVLGFAHGGVMPHTGVALVGERGPELLQLPGGSRVTPLPAPTPMPATAASGAPGAPVIVHVQVDRRTIATAVAEDTADQRARR